MFWVVTYLENSYLEIHDFPDITSCMLVRERERERERESESERESERERERERE